MTIFLLKSTRNFKKIRPVSLHWKHIENVDVGGPELNPSKVTTVPKNKKNKLTIHRFNSQNIGINNKNLFRISEEHHFESIIFRNTIYLSI